MSSLNDTEKRYLEKILEMGSGYVLDFTDATFGEFFGRHGVDIHGPKYRTYGTSKAKKMRSFWEQETDILVGRVLSEMLDSYEVLCDLSSKQVDDAVLKRSRRIVARLVGTPQMWMQAKGVDNFLSQEYAFPNTIDLPVESEIVPIIESRLDEAQKAMEAGAYLAVIVLCGSILEGILLGQAQKEPALFNRSSSSPKKENGKVKRFHEWSLAQLIDVASDVGTLKPDVHKFSHGLRDFRNYIHPYQQSLSGFAPDEHTASVCFQVLKAALASVAGKRK